MTLAGLLGARLFRVTQEHDLESRLLGPLGGWGPSAGAGAARSGGGLSLVRGSDREASSDCDSEERG